MPPNRTGALRHFTLEVLIVLAIGAVAFTTWRLSQLFLLLFAGILLAIVFHGLSERLSHHTKLPLRASLVVVVLLLIAALAGFFWLLGSQIAQQFDELLNQLPQAIQTVRRQLDGTPFGRFLIEQTQKLNLGEDPGLLSQVTGIASTALTALTSLVLILFIGLFLAANPGLYRAGLIRLVPKAGRRRAQQLLDAMGADVWRWLRGQFVSMVAIGILTTAGLWLLGIPMALALGILAGILEFVPYIGPIAASIPAILVGFTQGPMTALWVALLYTAIQQFESNAMLPLIQKRAVALPPVLTVTATVAFGLLFGFAGVLLATPLIVVGIVMVRLLYVENVLHDYGDGGVGGGDH